MTILVAIIILLATFAFCAAMHQRCRANNLELLNSDLHAKLDDATRDRDRYRTSNAYLIREATTLSWDIAKTEESNVYLRSCLRRQRECAAGVLLGRQVAAERKAS